MQFSEEKKWQSNEVTNWKLELFEYLRSSLFFPEKLLKMYDRLEPNAVVGLVGGYMKHPTGQVIGKLFRRSQTTRHTQERREP